MTKSDAIHGDPALDVNNGDDFRLVLSWIPARGARYVVHESRTEDDVGDGSSPAQGRRIREGEAKREGTHGIQYAILSS